MSDAAPILTGIGMIVIAVLLWLIGAAAANGRLKRNWFAGMRTRATTASPEAWLAAHVASEPMTRFAAVATGAAGIALLAIRPEESGYRIIMLVGAGVSLIAILSGGVVAQRAAKAVNS